LLLLLTLAQVKKAAAGVKRAIGAVRNFAKKAAEKLNKNPVGRVIVKKGRVIGKVFSAKGRKIKGAFRKVGQGFKKVGKAIGNGIKKVGSKLKV
jgi:hypothetical protein